MIVFEISVYFETPRNIVNCEQNLSRVTRIALWHMIRYTGKEFMHVFLPRGCCFLLFCWYRRISSLISWPFLPWPYVFYIPVLISLYANFSYSKIYPHIFSIFFLFSFKNISCQKELRSGCYSFWQLISRKLRDIENLEKKWEYAHYNSASVIIDWDLSHFWNNRLGGIEMYSTDEKFIRHHAC